MEIKEKNVLITGQDGYIARHVCKWLSQRGMCAHTVGVRDDSWHNLDFSEYDAVLHAAAIVHRANERIPWEVYKQVNTNLTLALAEKAKRDGVGQFLFMSSMGIFGLGKGLPDGNIIDLTSMPDEAAQNYYSRSKLLAEKGLLGMASDDFSVTLLRPPGVYGKACKGNYINGYRKLAMLPIFPLAYEHSRQSFLYIDNLAELIRLLIESKASGAFMPQDGAPVSSVELIELIRQIIGKEPHFSKLLGGCIRLLSFVPIVRKVYGGICYADDFSMCPVDGYRLVSTTEGMKRTLMP